ncbi:MAG: PEP-CTERM sorting domain-containing protein [Kiritimatiellae bacterium]|nr:PEP-CTERM sorting domain-containing protein [Kiritimatiellia bacterium]
MKKIMIAVAIVCAAVVSHAAAFSWEGFDIKDINGDDYTGPALLHCVEIASLGAQGAVDAGELTGGDLESDLFEAGTIYSFFFTSEDAAGNTYTSETATAKALGVGTASISFEGNGTWTAAPEPTSGLLLLLGMAGLALKRKRA